MAARIIKRKRGSLYDNILSTVANTDSIDYILQDTPPPPLSSDTLNDTFIHMGGNISYLTNLKKQTVASDIENRRGKDIIEEGAKTIA